MLPLEITQFRLNRPGLRAVLGDLETKLMEIIWIYEEDFKTQGKDFTNRELLKILNRRRKKPLVVSTVQITMTRLFKKGLVDRRLESTRGGHHYIYQSLVTKETFVRQVSEQILAHLRRCFGDTVSIDSLDAIMALISGSNSESRVKTSEVSK